MRGALNLSLPFLLTLAACAAAPEAPHTQAAPSSLTGTSWRLVSFRSSGDAVGAIVPSSPNQYTLAFAADGHTSMTFDCNRGGGTWQASASGDGGGLRFGPIATTRMLCPPGPLDARLPRDMEYVRNYRIVDGRLNLGLTADGGVYTWERITP